LIGLGALICALGLANHSRLDAAEKACLDVAAQTGGRPMVDIGEFGAHPDDGVDDGDGVAAAIVAAGPDKTLVFAPGQYQFSKSVTLASRQTYFGRPGAKLSMAKETSGFVFTADDLTGVRIACLTFEGGGLRFGGFTRDLEIANNSFANIYDPASSFGHESGIFVAGLTDRARIIENDFQDIGIRAGKAGASHGVAILAFHLNNTEIADNTFRRVHQAISLIFQGKAGSGLGVVVRGNRVDEAFRMGIEAQGDGTNGALFEDNEVKIGDRGSESIGLSIVINGGVATQVNRNRVVSLTPAKAKCAGFGIEAAGFATKVTANQAAGNWCAAIGVHADQAQYSIVADNRICGQTSQYPAIDFYNGIGRSRSTDNKVLAQCGGDPTSQTMR
jgi:hypothetical protein